MTALVLTKDAFFVLNTQYTIVNNNAKCITVYIGQIMRYPEGLRTIFCDGNNSSKHYGRLFHTWTAKWENMHTTYCINGGKSKVKVNTYCNIEILCYK